MPLPAVAGLVLAGGEGRRMGGKDKGLQWHHGLPLVAYALIRLRPQVDRLFISANRNHEVYASFGYRLVQDAAADTQRGPLAGILAALETLEEPLLAVVPCDSPGFPTDLVARLTDALTNSDSPIAMARTSQRFEPLFMLCQRRIASTLGTFLASGGRKVLDWCEAAGYVACDFSDSDAAFRNLNRPQELFT